MKCDKDKYIGFDLPGKDSGSGTGQGCQSRDVATMVATEAAAVIRFLKSLSGPLHITFEETDTGAMDVGRRARICERSRRMRSPRKQTAG
jgi:hypothetical protein